MHGSVAAVGVDLVLVRQIEASVARFDQRFLRRVYTDAEIRYCGELQPLAGARFAARFAAKEAVLKALALHDVGLSLREIEVVRQPSGACAVQLHGTADALARGQGFCGWTLSMSHEGDYATAVVLGLRGSAPQAITDAAAGDDDARTRADARAADARPHSDGVKRRPGSMEEQIRSILREHGRLAVSIDSLAAESDLYQAGMTSHASVDVMLALEGTFDVEFPDRMLRRSVFASIVALRDAVAELVSARG